MLKSSWFYFLAAVVASGGGWFFYTHYQTTLNQTIAPTATEAKRPPTIGGSSRMMSPRMIDSVAAA